MHKMHTISLSHTIILPIPIPDQKAETCALSLFQTHLVLGYFPSENTCFLKKLQYKDKWLKWLTSTFFQSCKIYLLISLKYFSFPLEKMSSQNCHPIGCAIRSRKHSTFWSSVGLCRWQHCHFPHICGSISLLFETNFKNRRLASEVRGRDSIFIYTFLKRTNLLNGCEGLKSSTCSHFESVRLKMAVADSKWLRLTQWSVEDCSHLINLYTLETYKWK